MANLLDRTCRWRGRSRRVDPFLRRYRKLSLIDVMLANKGRRRQLGGEFGKEIVARNVVERPCRGEGGGEKEDDDGGESRKRPWDLFCSHHFLMFCPFGMKNSGGGGEGVL